LHSVTTIEVTDKDTHPEDTYYPGLGKFVTLPILGQLSPDLEVFMYKPSDLSIEIIETLKNFHSLAYLNYSVPYYWYEVLESSFSLHAKLSRLKIYDARLRGLT
jgi:hypothetical protein